MGYSTKYERPTRGITCETLARLNGQVESPLLKQLLLGRFSVSQVRSLEPVDEEMGVVNFEVKGTQTYALTGIVTHNCTSTLELGIDIGTVDKVVQYNSPRQVTSLIQRVGRSGHTLDRTSRGLVLAVSSDDAIESLAAVEAAKGQDLERLHIHRLALDVLAHQIVGCALDQVGTAPWFDILSTICTADSYRELDEPQAHRVA